MLKNSHRVDNLWSWIKRRQTTIGLAAFFSVWYLFQLVIFSQLGEELAIWLFYFEQPPDALSPGVIFAPISHDFSKLTHLGGNLIFLVVAGGLAEPTIGGRKLLAIVLGIGYVGTYLANATVFIHGLWMVAGASGGILGLWAYTGLLHRPQFREFTNEKWGLSSEGIERIAAVTILISVPIFTIYEIFIQGRFHSGHTIGIILGGGFYYLETRFE